MDVFSAIEKRRAVKHFDPDYRMTQEEIDRLISGPGKGRLPDTGVTRPSRSSNSYCRR